MLSQDHKFSWWIDTKLFSVENPNCWELVSSEPVPHPTAIVPVEPLQTQSSNKINQVLRDLKYRLGYFDIPGTRLSGLLLGAYINLLPKSPSKVTFSKNPDFYPEKYFPKAFLKVLKSLIYETMPNSFTSDFGLLAQNARRFRYVPGRLRLGTLSMWNDKEKVIAAFAQQAGEKRVVFQHGGEYGMVKYNLLANEMELKSTIFISWGWSGERLPYKNIIPLPSPFLSQIANRHKRRNDNIIIVGAGFRTLVSRIHWWSILALTTEPC